MKESFQETPPIKPSTRQKILKILLDSPIINSVVDKIGKERAVDLVEKTKIREHIKEGGKYLDIGTGLGHIIEEVANKEDEKNAKFLTVESIWDPTKKVQERAKEKNSILFMKGRGEELPIKDKTLDGVSLFFVLHHMPPEGQEQIFNEIERVLKDDGLLFLTEDTPESEQEQEGNANWDRRLNFEPKTEKHYYKNNQEWLDFLENKGYELIDESYFEDHSPKKNEGTIKHRSYILKRVPQDIFSETGKK